MRVSYGPPGAKGVTTLVAVGDNDFVPSAISPIGSLDMGSLSSTAVLLIGVAGVVGYMLGRRR